MRGVLAAAMLCALSLAAAAPAEAAHRHRHHHVDRQERGLATVPTAAGVSITVAAHLAGQFQELIADFVAAGYRPHRIHCFASGGHVRHSRHYAGAACDFDQRGWGKTVAFMYRAHEIIARHGLRDGCSFHDCGHVDDGMIRRARRSYASR